MSVKNIIPLSIEGCYKIIPNIFEDARGLFIKTFHNELYEASGIKINIAEEYYSISNKNALRGMHFQIAPRQHYKLIYCIAGEIQDAFVDLRQNSPSFQKAETIVLNSTDKNIVCIAPEVAHGFLTLSEQSIVINKTSSVYAPDYERGIHWQDSGVPWKTNNPIVSIKDKNLPKLKKYITEVD